jgi:hypothetical protein
MLRVHRHVRPPSLTSCNQTRMLAEYRMITTSHLVSHELLEEGCSDLKHPLFDGYPFTSAQQTSLVPAATLLLSLPGLLMHPPTHHLHLPSLYLSYHSHKRCIALGMLSPDLECRAWTGLAEIGMNVIDGGLIQNIEHSWTTDIESEVCFAVLTCLCLFLSG